MAGENLDPARYFCSTSQFVERGGVNLLETATDDWEEEIGVLIDPEEYAEVWWISQ